LLPLQFFFQPPQRTRLPSQPMEGVLSITWSLIDCQLIAVAEEWPGKGNVDAVCEINVYLDVLISAQTTTIANSEVYIVDSTVNSLLICAACQELGQSL
jgi:hypothetical protein